MSTSPAEHRTLTAGAVGIIGTGSYLPPVVVPNAPVAAAAGVDADWIERKTLIRERRHALPGQATSDLAVEAARRALEDAGVLAADLAVVVVSTSTPDSPQPPTASLVQQALGADGAAAFDVNAVCSGFVYALEVARSLLVAAGDGRPALVVGADVYSRILDPSDRRTAVLFGDGAGAVVLGAVPAGQELGRAVLHGVGSRSELISVPAGGSRRPASAQTLAAGEHWFRMDGRGVREFVEEHVPGLVGEVLAGAGWEPSSVDHVVPHQGNGVMLAALAGSLGLPRARMHTTVEELGNTGSASVPVTLDAARRSGALRPGERVLLLAFGGGMNLAGVACTWLGAPLRPAAAATSALPAPRSARRRGTTPVPLRAVGGPVSPA
ncbi:3-oxoacyl-ACP synthase III family protein [Quadrisphaera sp. KR29]|uniref:3-oxoacyl-ACP synthase III family protein n=1 Tax=Quadrisphaera sp. KR29 TaxID=3461391 RepID=UPI004043ABFF